MRFDADKDQRNRAKHGLSLARAADLDLRKAMVDARHDYGETRFIGYGLLDDLPHVLVFTLRDGEVRPIRLRRAHIREYSRHVP